MEAIDLLPTPLPKHLCKYTGFLPHFMGLTGQMKPIHELGTQVKKPASRILPLDIILLSTQKGILIKSFFYI